MPLTAKRTGRLAALPNPQPWVTWTGQLATSRTQPVGEESSVRLHFLVFDHLSGFGVVAAGWLADPSSQVAIISIADPTGAPKDLLSEAALLTDRHQMKGLDLPSGVGAKVAFVTVLPEGAFLKADGFRLSVQLADGQAFDCLVPAVGEISDLGDILAAADIDYGFRALERLLGTLSRRVPEGLAALAGQIHQRIRHDDGFDLTCHVDAAIRVGTAGMLVAGWLISDPADPVQRVSLVSLSGRRVVLQTPFPAKFRPDVAASDKGALAPNDCGFAAYGAIEGLDPLDTLWFVEAVLASGTIRRAPFVCPPTPRPLLGIESAVALADERDSDLAVLFERAISPAVEWFWAETRRAELVSTAMVYGRPPAAARVSIVVPVYGRLDFVRHQIARFSNDPEFRAEIGTIELIYVLDDPTKGDEFSRLCRLLHDVYQVPFRTLVQNQNRGYSAATNAGAAIATGRFVLLLNSDVFPRQPRWVGQLAAAYDSLDRCGILGCRLLFEDGSIQHAGMDFRESRLLRGCWVNDHPGRGLSVSFDTNTEAAPVPAVTGACLMIERALFDRLGGLSEAYIIADFEDSDLCLRVQEEGLRTYYTPLVELYHLERQSVRLVGHGNAKWRQMLTLFNMWKHSRRWGEAISKIRSGVAVPAERVIADIQPEARPRRPARSGQRRS